MRLPAETGATSCDNQESTTFNKRRPCFSYTRDFLSGATRFSFLCFLLFSRHLLNCISHIVQSSAYERSSAVCSIATQWDLATQVVCAPPDPEAPRSPSAQRPSGQAQHRPSPTLSRSSPALVCISRPVFLSAFFLFCQCISRPQSLSSSRVHRGEELLPCEHVGLGRPAASRCMKPSSRR